jgi:DNA polymerase II large subunit
MSPADQQLIDNFRTKAQQITMGECTSCKEKWFDLKIVDGKCSKCKSNKKFTAENNMDPG